VSGPGFLLRAHKNLSNGAPIPSPDFRPMRAATVAPQFFNQDQTT
jgi:hypothetical protein